MNIRNWLTANPVFIKELRERMRGPRAYLFLSGTLMLFSAITYGLYRLAAAGGEPSLGLGRAGATIGQSVFSGLVILTTLAICAMTPALTAGAISGEFENKSFDLLASTPLAPSAVLLGKWLAALSYALLILLALVPLVSLAFIFGGVTTSAMLWAFVLLLSDAVLYSVIGLFFSALFRRTSLALGASYLVLALFVLGTSFAFNVIGVTRPKEPPILLLALNPFSAMASALDNPLVANALPPAGLIAQFAALLAGGRFGRPEGGARPLWQLTLGLYTWLTLVLFLLATQCLQPARRWRPSGRLLSTVALLLVVSIVAPPVLYGPFTMDRISNWARWTFQPPGNLVTNGRFTAPLEANWTTTTEGEREDESGGEVKLVNTGAGSGLQISRRGAQHAATNITQVISQTVPLGKSLHVHAVLRVQSHDLEVCGEMGSECPLMIKVTFEDALGHQQLWVQGFYARQGDNIHFCGSCESKARHIQVVQGEWYTFDSPNLIQPPSPPLFLPLRLINSITLSASGHSYNVEVAEIGLLTRQGTPPDWTNAQVIWAAPTPVFSVPPTPRPLRGGPLPHLPPPPPPTPTVVR